MSSIVTDYGILHFEAVGRGRPLILLHGWVNSWDVWRGAMLTLAHDHDYRVYALDFWGFGDSAKPEAQPDQTFRIKGYVEMVQDFMDNLGISSAPIAGHSMGGTVALKFALDHGERVDKVILVSSPIVGSSLNPILKLAGYRLTAELVWRVPYVIDACRYLLLAGDSDHVRAMILRDMGRTTKQSYFRSIGDLRGTNLRRQLAGLAVPLLGVYGQHDNIVSPRNATLLKQTLPSAQVVIMSRSRHFPMVDEENSFLTGMVGFLTNNRPRLQSAYGQTQRG
jgi:pimeloyl-ACP methyl ester carboxylesterase